MNPSIFRIQALVHLRVSHNARFPIQECFNLFSSGGGQKLAEECGAPFLGRIPIDPLLGQTLDGGENFLEKFPESQLAGVLKTIIEPLVNLPPRQKKAA